MSNQVTQNFEQLITDHIDIWSSSILAKSTSGRGSSKKYELYGINKLRELILDLAVRGKLIPQDPNDVPLSNILEDIVSERKQLISEGQVKKHKVPAKITLEEIPFSIPTSWKWFRLGEISSYGNTQKAENSTVSQDTWVLELEDIEKKSSRLIQKVRFSERQFKSTKSTFQENDVLYGKLRPYLDKVIVADQSGVCTTEIIPIRCYSKVYPYYLRYYLKSPAFIKYADNSTHGMNLPRLGTQKAVEAVISLPPFNEQKRIVAKVDELMQLCDHLDQQTESSIDAHATLVEVLLNTLTDSEDADALKQNWARLADNFDIIFTTEQSIEALKQTILQLAVMGKLVPQNPDDEPASVLLDKIEEEKQRLIGAGEIKKTKTLPPVENEPFILPKGWRWSKLGNCSANIHYGYTASADNNLTEFRMLRITDIQDNKVNWDNVPGCEITKEKAVNYLLKEHDILIARTGGTIGKSYLVENISVQSVFASYLIRVQTINSIDARFIKVFLGSELYWKQLLEASMGTGQPNVNGNSLKSLDFPLPPLAEQKRIVAKVEELMAICDQLKEQLQQSQQTQVKLTDALVDQALA